MAANKNEKILVTIAARGGSKGLNNKNVRLLAGLPLIAHTIRQAKRWGKADRIVCSTDSEQIAAIAREHGAEVPFMRPTELATDSSGKVEAIRHALKQVEAADGVEYSIIVDLDATAPIRKIEDIDSAVELFKAKRPKTVFSVTSSGKNPYFNMVEAGAGGYVTLSKRPEKPILSRQTAPKVYDMNASIYVYDRNYLLDENTKTALSDRSLIMVMDENSAFDIDTELDFQFVEYLTAKGLVKL